MWGVICRVSLLERSGGCAAAVCGNESVVDCLVDRAAVVMMLLVSAIAGCVRRLSCGKVVVDGNRPGTERLVRTADDERRIEDVMRAGAEA